MNNVNVSEYVLTNANSSMVFWERAYNKTGLRRILKRAGSKATGCSFNIPGNLYQCEALSKFKLVLGLCIGTMYVYVYVNYPEFPES